MFEICLLLDILMLSSILSFKAFLEQYMTKKLLVAAIIIAFNVLKQHAFSCYVATIDTEDM